MKAAGPDSWVSWRNAILAGFIQIPVLVCLKTTGVIFVGFLNKWHIRREQASWPLTLFIVASQMCAPVFPLLQRRCSPSSLLTFSCALATCSQFLTYYAENVFHFSISFVFQGIAVTGVYMFSLAIFMQHFQTKRTAATGVASAISSGIATFAPNFLQFIIKELGIKMAMPMLGIASSVSLLLSVFLKSPRWLLEQQKEAPKNESKEQSEKENFVPPEKSVQGFEATKQPSHYMLSGTFVMDVFCMIVVYNANNTFMMVAFDYARDQGIQEASAVYVLPLSAAGDLIMRTLSGFLIDAKIVSWNSLFAAAFLLEALCLLVWVTCSKLWALLVVSFFVGGCNGSLISLIPILLVNDFGISRFMDSFGASLFVCGIVTSFKPLLDGYFRDVRGSYNGLFLLIVGLCVPCGAYWLYRMSTSGEAAKRNPSAKEDFKAQTQNV